MSKYNINVIFVFFYKKCKNNQFLIYENSLKFGFLEKFTQKLYTDLYNLRQKNAHMICCLILKKIIMSTVIGLMVAQDNIIQHKHLKFVKIIKLIM